MTTLGIGPSSQFPFCLSADRLFSGSDVRAVRRSCSVRVFDDRSMPSVVSVLRLISRSWTSMMTSPFDLSFESISFAAIATLSGVSLIETEFSGSFSATCRELRSVRIDRDDLLGVGARQVERADHLVFELLPLLAVVRGDQERVLVDDLVEVLRLQHQDVERALERDASDLDRHAAC